MGCGSSADASQSNAPQLIKMPKNMEAVSSNRVLSPTSKSNVNFFAKPLKIEKIEGVLAEDGTGKDSEAKGIVVEFVSEFTPLPGFVVKTHRTVGDSKVFINILKSNEIPWPKLATKALTFPARTTFDKTNMDVALYDHVIPVDSCVACDEDPTQVDRRSECE